MLLGCPGLLEYCVYCPIRFQGVEYKHLVLAPRTDQLHCMLNTPTYLVRGMGGMGGSTPRTHGTKGICQVEGCYQDLSGLRDYHVRYKICENHLKVCWPSCLHVSACFGFYIFCGILLGACLLCLSLLRGLFLCPFVPVF